MRLSRRDFLKLAGAAGVLATVPTALLRKALAGTGDPRVIWLQGQSCSGCSVSLLNAVSSLTCGECATVDQLLTDVINLEYHSTLIAAAGDLALSGAFGPHPSNAEVVEFAEQWLNTGANKLDLSGADGTPDGRVNLYDFSALRNQGYVLVVEGAIPLGSEGKFCDIGGHTTMKDAFSTLGSGADVILAVGACATFGGIPAAGVNPTGAASVEEAMTALGISKTLVNIPGCPMHPEWFVQTVLKLLGGEAVPLDNLNRPDHLFGDASDPNDRPKRVHMQCPLRGGSVPDAPALGGYGCLENFGCRGKVTYANCPTIKWNGPTGGLGVNWCVQSRTPCYGCTEPTFPGDDALVAIDHS